MKIVVVAVLLAASIPVFAASSDPRPATAKPESAMPYVYDANRRQLPVYYRNCDAARAAGVVPIHRGEPGYRPGLDADNDGIACEPYNPR